MAKVGECGLRGKAKGEMKRMFTRNESNADRLIRAVAGIVLLWLGLGPLKAFSGSAVGIIVLVLAVIALFTAITGFCAIYRLLGLSTAEK